MLSARLIWLFALLFVVNAKAFLPSEDDLTSDDFEEEYLNSFDEQMLMRNRRDADDEAGSQWVYDEQRTVNDGRQTVNGEPTSAEQASSAEPESPPAAAPGTTGESGECVCPSRHHDVRPHPCVGLSKSACREKMAPPPYTGPPCELRPIFRVPMDFNHTARKACFERWEKPALEAKGVDFSKPRENRNVLRPRFQRTLMIHKGCDSQCMFSENQLLVEDGDDVKLSKDAVLSLLKEDDDPQELLDIFEEQVDKCIEEANDLVHQKQSCKSGSDEFLECLNINVANACSGAKWKGSKSCENPEDTDDKVRNCRREQRSIFMSHFHHRGMKHFRHMQY